MDEVKVYAPASMHRPSGCKNAWSLQTFSVPQCTLVKVFLTNHRGISVIKNLTVSQKLQKEILF